MPPAALSIHFIFLALLAPACETWTTEKGPLLSPAWDSSANKGVGRYLSSRSSYVFLALEFHSGSRIWKLLLTY